MAVYQLTGLQFIGIILSLFLGWISSVNAKDIAPDNLKMTQLFGSVISTPCSIAIPDRYQSVDFSPLTITNLSTKLEREQQTRPFEIELRDCGTIHSPIDSKTWIIRFDGQVVRDINAFALQGPSSGLGVSVLDNSKNILTPGQNYSLFNSILNGDKTGQTFYLRYFLRLELTGKPLQAGSYQGFVRFFIDYQ